MMKKSTSSEHLGWVVLLLAAAVILPTVCLLWFMAAAVRNERLAVRQKLIDLYTAKARSLTAYAVQNWNARKTEMLALDEIYRQKNSPALDKAASSAFVGFLLFDENAALIYPRPDDEMETESPQMFSLLNPARRLEFVDKKYADAAQSYGRLIDPNAGPLLRQMALAGKARCLGKDSKLSEAKELYRQLAETPTTERMNPVITSQSRLRLAELYAATSDPQLVPWCRLLLQTHLVDLDISTSTRFYLLNQILTLIDKVGIADKISVETIDQVKGILAFDSTSIQAAETAFVKGLDNIAVDGVYMLDEKENLYGYVLHRNNRRMIGLATGMKLAADWTEAAKELDDNIVFYRIYNSDGRFVCGKPEIWVTERYVESGLFLSKPPGEEYPGWKVEVYFRDGVFPTAAYRQQMTYIWSSVLAIILMTLFIFLAAREILHQARLNRLKNSFVATVTHELKTPLSSMRLLVDTLLDGNYTNQQQCKEYLELISHENERLSRMIDSFLTFSRMERNKQVFDFKTVNPCEIVSAAALAVQPKMNQPGCHFTVLANENLPQVRADKDAMITVLVNLLDNAYKYSNLDKTIELKAYSENRMVCFAVRDNGVGIPRRIQKKVFDRFFQADSRLSRTAEGCGLGLSIVKFIVNAHKGLIEVDSKPGNGSCFIVKLPILEKCSNNNA